MDDETFEKMKAAKAKYHPIAMKIPGVHGTSIGFKVVGGKRTDTIAICIHLTQKKPLTQLLESERLPEAIEGFPVDVLEHEQVKPCAVDETKYRPIKCGCKVATGMRYGTIGCFVKDTKSNDGKWYALTNKHVLDEGDWGYQPYERTSCIGKTTRAVLNEHIDASICSIDYYDDEGTCLFVDGVGVKEPYNVGRNDLGTYVRKYGCATGKTTGAIQNINWHGTRTDGHEMKNQIMISAGSTFADHGDSGSVVTLMDGRVIGLLWGLADDSTSFGVASLIQDVIDELEVEIITCPDE